MRRLPLLLAAVFAVLAVAGPIGSAQAVPFAYFPALPPPTQITREISLPQAARAGVVKLDAKGGGQGDAVSLELDGTKKVRGPLTVTVRVEATMLPTKTPLERESMRDFLPSLWKDTEADMNHLNYKTRDGDPIKFVIEGHWREPEAAPTSNYHQIEIVNPKTDLGDDPDPIFRSRIIGSAIPNTPTPIKGVFSTDNLMPKVMGHEMMHVVGLGDRYVDYYRYGKKKVPLPEKAMSPKALKKFLGGLKPPVPPPPAGRVFSEGIPGSDPCDMMGSGLNKDCRKLNKDDLKWIEDQAGTLVTAEPGELLLNKDASSQNFGIAFKTLVFAPPGSTTVAPGIAVYCIDHDRTFPFTQSFDVGPAAGELPGYDGVLKLLRLNAELQPNLNESIEGMQAAIWNLTDASPLATSGTAEQSRSLMARAGVVEDSVPGGLPPLADPNGAAPSTGAVDTAGATLPPLPTEPSAAQPQLRIFEASLFSRKMRTGGNIANYLLLGTTGPASGLSLKLQRRVGKKWKQLKKLPARKLKPGMISVQLSFGPLNAGKYRLLVTVSGGIAETATTQVPFAVKR